MFLVRTETKNFQNWRGAGKVKGEGKGRRRREKESREGRTEKGKKRREEGVAEKEFLLGSIT